MVRNTFIFLVFIWNVPIFYAQEVIGAGGDFFSSSNGSLSWTAGEVITETVVSPNGIFTQGFQQNYENFVSLETILFANDLLVFPNPFNSELNIQWSTGDFKDLGINLSDGYGKTFTEIYIENSSVQKMATLDVSQLAAGVYYLTVTHKNISTPIVFKVIKL